MDFIQRVLQFFANVTPKEHNGLVEFIHESDDPYLRRVVTIHAEKEKIIFSIFTDDQFQMVLDVCELTGSDISKMIKDLADNNEIVTIAIDPKEMN